MHLRNSQRDRDHGHVHRGCEQLEDVHHDERCAARSKHGRVHIEQLPTRQGQQNIIPVYKKIIEILQYKKL